MDLTLTLGYHSHIIMAAFSKPAQLLALLLSAHQPIKLWLLATHLRRLATPATDMLRHQTILQLLPMQTKPQLGHSFPTMAARHLVEMGPVAVF